MQVKAVGQVGRLLDAGSWLSPEEEAGLRAAVPRIQTRCAELAGYAVPPSIVHGDLHLSNVARGPKGHLFFDWTDACVAHPFLDLATIRRGTAFVDSTDEAELRERLGQAYRPSGPPSSHPGAWPRPGSWPPRWAPSTRRSATAPWPPGDPHMAQSTAWWLRQVLACLA
jgi:hypothetical protein